MYQRLRNHFEHTRWYHLVMTLKWKLVLVLSDIVLILTQDRSTVCVERTIGARFASSVPQAWKSFWTHLMELLGDVGHMESYFFPFGDSVSVGAR